VTAPHLFATAHRSPQLPLWVLGEGEWLQVLRVPAYAPRKRSRRVGAQPALFALEARGAYYSDSSVGDEPCYPNVMTSNDGGGSSR